MNDVEQLNVLRQQLEQSMAQTTDAQQEKAAAESERPTQKLHLEQELEVIRPIHGNLQRLRLRAFMCSVTELGG